MVVRMPKRKKPEPELPPPLNLPDGLSPMEAIEDITVIASGVMQVTADPLRGMLTIVTPVGYYTFMMDGEETVNGIIQDLRKLLRGDSAPLIEE